MELAYALGLKVNREPMPDDISGYLRRTDDGWELGVNSLHHPNRQRFTLAHELGHYFLHRDHGAFTDGLLFRRENQRNALERQANNFAAMLLMPTIPFKRELRHNDLTEVARNFGVSRQAAQYRLDNISDQVEIY
jgi:Zn-dependent peptidase ImmA (M78 family)